MAQVFWLMIGIVDHYFLIMDDNAIEVYYVMIVINIAIHQRINDTTDHKQYQ